MNAIVVPAIRLSLSWRRRRPLIVLAALRSIRPTGQAAIGEMGTLLGLVRGEPQAPREPQPSLADLDALISRTRDSGLPVELAIEGKRCTLAAAAAA